MKQYLIDTFWFNDWANKLTLSAMQTLADKKESVILFSHLITAQNKWLLRIKNDPAEAQIKWFDAPFEVKELTALWEASLKEWLEFLSDLNDSDLYKEIFYSAMSRRNQQFNTFARHCTAAQLPFDSAPRANLLANS